MMKKKIALSIALLVLVNVLCFLSFAHRGGTDGNGGHYDRSTGEYHFHHGYSAHDHYDMDGDGIVDCPYNFEDKTDHDNHNNNSTSNRLDELFEANNESDNSEKVDTQKELSFWDVVSIVFQIICYSFLISLALMVTLILPLVSEGINLLVICIGKKIFKIDIGEETQNRVHLITLITSLLIICIVVSVFVLRSYGII